MQALPVIEKNQSDAAELRLGDIPLQQEVELVSIDLPADLAEPLLERGVLPRVGSLRRLGCSVLVCPQRASRPASWFNEPLLLDCLRGRFSCARVFGGCDAHACAPAG